MKSSTFDLSLIDYNYREIRELFPYFCPFGCFFHYCLGKLLYVLLKCKNTELYIVYNTLERVCCNQKCFISQRFVVKQNQEHYTWCIFQQ